MKMKKMILLLMLIVPMICFAQEENRKKDSNKATKMEQFASSSGYIVKFIDRKAEKLSGFNSVFASSSENCVRKVIRGGEEKFFYRIEKKNKDKDGSVAFIEYSDLKEIISALESLIRDLDKDIADNPDYLENKYRTEDFFVVGYYIKKGTATWYIRLEEYGYDKYLHFSNKGAKGGEYILENFTKAQNMIESWMKE